MSTARSSPTRTLAAAVLAAAAMLAATGLSTADEPPPSTTIECPPDLGIDEPIGPCGRDGNGPGEPTTTTTRDPESIDHEDPPPFVVECPYEVVPDHAGAAICADPPIVVRAADPVPYMDRSLPYSG